MSKNFFLQTQTQTLIFLNYSREDVRKGLGILERHGLTFDIHGYPWNLGYVTKIAQEFPNLKLVIDHLAKPNIQACF